MPKSPGESEVGTALAEEDDEDDGDTAPEGMKDDGALKGEEVFGLRGG